MTDQVDATFDRTVDEGEQRLRRSWPELIATGLVGGVDISVGVFALLVVEHETGNVLLAALAFSLGFIALTLASSELFTENFLIPISALAAGRARITALARLWGVTAAFNLLAAWVVMFVVISSSPALEDTAVEVAQYYVDLGIGWRSFALAIMGGTVITLMTWMQHATEDVGGQMVSAVGIAFLLAAAKLNHVIVVSVLVFAALHAGAPFGYDDWVRLALWSALGNVVGGVGLVTLLRLVQVGRRTIEEKADEVGAETPL